MKILLFDIDGVLIYHTRNFVDHISQNLKPEGKDILLKFHNGQINQDCDKGLKDPRKEIETYLKEADLNISGKEYFDLQHEFEKSGIDHELLRMISKVDKNQYACFIASNQNMYRKKFLIKQMKLNEIFEKNYFSSDFNQVKPEMEYWDYIYQDVKTKYSDVLKTDVYFYDDRKINTDSAKKFGFNVKLINERKDLEEELVYFLP